MGHGNPFYFSGAPRVTKSGNPSMREIVVLTSRTPVRTDSGGGGDLSQGNPTEAGERLFFLAGNRAVLLGNQRFSWRKIA